MSRTAAEPIAIVGIGCRFPGGVSSPAEFWSLMRGGVSAIGEVPRERFDLGALYDAQPATPGRVMSRFGGFLTGIEDLDADFFHMSPREAASLDPQQRLLLEVAFEALEAGGQPLQRWHGRSVGVFVGMWLNEYEARMFRRNEDIEFYMTTGTGRYSASGRLSNQFGWTGPSMTVDCACSSSLVAIHLACQSLRLGESEMALAGGANVILEPSITIAYSQSRMMAPDGRCKFGDAAADGYVRSDGAGIVVLKRLADAVAAGDPVIAVIRGSAVNNDGDSSGSFGTPGRAGQEDMLRKAYENAALDPAAVWYVEAHGTGTRAGDPVEIGALGAVLGAGRAAADPLHVGSVKTNIGHTEGAAGVAGLIKAALTVQSGVIPRSLNLVAANPEIPWDNLRVAVPRAEVASARPGRIAGVSSFGIAGTNAHVIVAQAPARSDAAAESGTAQRPLVLPLSAASPAALRAAAQRMAAHLRSGTAPLEDVVHTASSRRSHLEHRLAVVGADAQALAEGCEAHAAGEERRGVVSGSAASAVPGGVAFVFPGQGGQWPGMARQLAAAEPVFAAALAECDAAVLAHGGPAVLETLRATDAAARFERMDIVQPVLFAVQVALARLWIALGVTPAAVVGHSMGEVAAAHIAGLLSLRDAVAVIVERSRLLQTVSGRGAMAVVELPFAAAEEAARAADGRLSVAVSNSEQSTVLSGDPQAVDALVARLEAAGVFCRRVNVTVAAHSAQMDPLRPQLVAGLAGLSARPAALPFISTVTGSVLDTPADAEYWGRNLREPVRFADAVRGLRALGIDAFVEIGPHPVLLHALRAGAAPPAISAVPSARREENESETLLESYGALYAAGARVDWSRLQPRGRHTDLPAYPWQRERFWIENNAQSAAVPAAASIVHTTEWREQALAAASAPAGQRIVIFAGQSAFCGLLAQALTRIGASVEVVSAGSEALASEAAARATVARVMAPGVVTQLVHCGGLDAASDWDEALAHGPLGLMHLAQALAACSLESQARLNVLGLAATEPVFGCAAALDEGMARSIDAEYPMLRVRAFFLGSTPGAADAQAVARTLGAEGAAADNQVRISGGVTAAKRLVRVAAPPASAALAGRDGTFLITGGLGGLGLLTARHLVLAEGVRSLVLAGRRAPDAAASAEIARLEAAGARIRTMRADIAEPAAAAALFTAIDGDGPPLTGVIHAAAVLDNGTLAAMSDASLREVAAAKARGAWNLHQLTAQRPLDTFLLYSSVAPLLGITLHANYSAANTFLEGLAVHRRARGLAGAAIAWGLWRGVGFAVAGGDRLAEFGLQSLAPEAALELLGRLLRLNLPYAAAFAADWRAFAAAFRDAAAWPIFTEVMAEAAPRAAAATPAAPAATLRAQAEALAPGAARLAFVEDRVCDIVAAVVRRGAGQLDRDKPFRALGVDSLMGLELRNRLAAAFAVAFPATLIWNFPNVRALAPELARRAGLAAASEEDGAAAERAELERMLTELEGMSEDDARARAAVKGAR